MTDAELIGLAAFVNASIVEATFANVAREQKRQAPAYGEDWIAPGSVELEAELRRRGVLKTFEEKEVVRVSHLRCAHCRTGVPHVCLEGKTNG